mmetsp:Transcript_13007/g.28114  ORF Transcript_13007/g.28114 Transcript_13007/m.28114 type:complete len:254 (+) Transcript_13007:1138-1899(+)
MDLVVAHVEVEVPARRPRNVRRLPHHVVRVDNLRAPGGHGREVGPQRDGGELGRRRIPRALVRVLHRVGLNLEADDARARKGVRLVVLDDEAQVVVDVGLVGVGSRDVLGADEAEAEAAVVHVLLGAVGHLGNHLGRGGQVVHDHMHAVVLSDPLREAYLLRLCELAPARYPELGLAHEDVIRRVLDHRAVQHLTQVLRLLHDRIGLAEGQAVVVIRQVRPRGRKFVDPDLYFIAILVLTRRDAREVKRIDGA